jgi:hypothetical protein
MTLTIVLNLIVSIIAIGGLAALTRLAYLAAGGKFDEAPASLQQEPLYELERAA